MHKQGDLHNVCFHLCVHTVCVRVGGAFVVMKREYMHTAPSGVVNMFICGLCHCSSFSFN